VAAIAVKQHGLITVKQAAECGLSRQMRTDRLRTGQLVRVDCHVLRVGGSPVTFESAVLAAVLAAGTGARASHRTAAALRTLDGYRPGVIEISIPRGRTFRRPGIVVHESSDLDRCTAQKIRGIPTTDAARTILDLARRSSDTRLFGAIESARRSSQTSWEGLVKVLLGHARQGRPGIQRLRRVIAKHIETEELTDSLFEALVLSLFIEHGLPQPVLHHQIVDDRGVFLAEVDLAYPSLMIAIELDGEIHRTREVFHRDRPRQNALELRGWTVLRFTWRQLQDEPDLIVRQVRQAIRNAQAR
jgi:hypothetical protein